MLTKRWMIASVTVVALSGCGAQETGTEVQLQQYDFSYDSYAKLLTETVADGLVDYANIKADRATLDSLVTYIGTADLSEATEAQRLAFYINAYNILTIRSIVDVYPVESIKDIDGVWDECEWRVAGKDITLNHIEHEVLRKQFSEPRIHVAISCASLGCPPLSETPYDPEHLDSLLRLASQRFAASPEHNQFDPDRATVRLSSVFDWFGEDFVEKYHTADRFPSLSQKENAALGFLLEHLPPSKTALERNDDIDVTYLDYDWSLNDLKR